METEAAGYPILRRRSPLVSASLDVSVDQAKTTGREKLDQTFNPKNFSAFGNFSIAEVNIYD